MVEEDPEDFFGDVDYFFAPDPVGSVDVHLFDKVKRFLVILWSRVFEVGQDGSGSRCQSGRVGVQGIGEVGKEEGDDDAAGAEFRWTLFLLVEEHPQQLWKEDGLDLCQMLQG
jgi:hypothetical protein